MNNLNAGDIIKFGSYKRRGIEWIVLDKKDDKALIISKYLLDEKPYHNDFDDATWETCSLRKWLNDDFLNEAFDKDEQKLILDTKVKAHKNPEYDTDPGNDTIDKLFLLNIDEAKKYFDGDYYRVCPYYDLSTGYWWLRSAGYGSGCAAGVTCGGFVDSYGGLVYDRYGVRPALWINLRCANVFSK